MNMSVFIFKALGAFWLHYTGFALIEEVNPEAMFGALCDLKLLWKVHSATTMITLICLKQWDKQGMTVMVETARDADSFRIVV